MTWRRWIVAWGAGLCSSLLTGCLHTESGDIAAIRSDFLAHGLEQNRKPNPAAEVAYPVMPLPAPVKKEADKPVPEVKSSDIPGPPETVALPVKGAGKPAQFEQANYPAPFPDKVIPPGTPRVSFEQGKEKPAEQPPEARLPVTETKIGKEAPLMAALRCFLDKRPAEAIDCLKDCDPLSQELLLDLLPLAARAGEGNLEQANSDEKAVILERLNSLQAPLRTQAALVIDKMCFCRHIDTFGVYDQMPDDPELRPGEWLLVYLELRNFTCEKRAPGPGQSSYVTRLVSSAEIRDYGGKKVWPAGGERLVFKRKGPDESRTVWHDYFDNCSLRVPDLPSGRYTLWIQVEDAPTKRTVKRSLDFRVNTTATARGS